MPDHPDRASERLQAAADALRAVQIHRSFVSEPVRKELCEWALSMREFLKDNKRGAGRRYRQVESLPYIPPAYTTVRRDIEARLHVEGFQREPRFGWYISIIEQGGRVHSHRDTAPAGFRHLRCNLFLQLPESGGYPVVSGWTHRVAAGDLLVFFPSERRHASEEVQGRIARVICSFGYLTPADYQLLDPATTS